MDEVKQHQSTTKHEKRTRVHNYLDMRYPMIPRLQKYYLFHPIPYWSLSRGLGIDVKGPLWTIIERIINNLVGLEDVYLWHVGQI